jgi:hypothetical protein
MKTVTKISMMLLISATLLISREFDRDTIKAFKKAGVDITKEKPTEAQIKVAQKYMMEADAKEEQEMQKEMEMSAKIMKKAYKKAGYDPKSGKPPTPKQMQDIQNYTAKIMFPIEKKKILEEGKSFLRAEGCLKKAKTLTDANSCVPSGKEPFEEWNDDIKKEVLAYGLSISCVEKANSMKDLQECYPKDER